MQLGARSARRALSVIAAAIAALATVVVAGAPAGATQSFLGRFSTISEVASTVPVSASPRPGDGDVNPYGVAVVPSSTGRLVKSDVLVSNFNDSANEQGTGRTIVEVSPTGSVTTFARIPRLPGGVGLTTAIAVLPRGFVVVGDLPTTDGSSATARRGGLLILDRDGALVDFITGRDINGPWDLTASSFGDFAALYFTNVLNGTVSANGSVVDRGTVVRLVLDLSGAFPKVVDDTVVGSGFPEETNPVALVIGPTGVALARNGTLYVADTIDNSIRAIPDADFRSSSAGLGRLLTTAPNALDGPLGLLVAPDGDLVAVNGANGKAVEISPSGGQVDTRFLDRTGTPPGNGALFGIAVAPHAAGLYFVDDDTNELDLLH